MASEKSVTIQNLINIYDQFDSACKARAQEESESKNIYQNYKNSFDEKLKELDSNFSSLNESLSQGFDLFKLQADGALDTKIGAGERIFREGAETYKEIDKLLRSKGLPGASSVVSSSQMETFNDVDPKVKLVEKSQELKSILVTIQNLIIELTQIRARSRIIKQVLAFTGIIALIAFVIGVYFLILELKYRNSFALLEEQRWAEVRDGADELIGIPIIGSYRSSEILKPESYYRPALIAFSAGDFQESLKQLEGIGETYKDSPELLNEIYYRLAQEAIAEEQLDEATKYINLLLSLNEDYLDTEFISEQVNLKLLRSGELDQSKIHNPNGSISSSAFDPDSLRFAALAGDGALYIWDLSPDAKTYLNTVNIKGSQSAGIVEFSPFGDLIAIGTDDGKVILLPQSEGLKLQVIQGPTDPIKSLYFSNDGALLITEFENETTIMWSLNEDIEQVGAWRFDEEDLAGSAYFLENYLAATISSLGELKLWDLASMIEMGEAQPRVFYENNEIVWESPNVEVPIVFSPDGNVIAVGGKELIIIDVANGRNEYIEGFSGNITSLVFSPEGLVVAAGTSLGEVSLWDVATFKAIKSSKNPFNGEIQSLDFSPDGEILIIQPLDDDIYIWNIQP